jgi:hypothetical protein
MQSLLSFAALATIVAQAGSPQPVAEGQPNWTAIHLQSCTILTRGAIGLETGGIQLQYVNRSRIDVTAVTFGVIYRGQPGVITDRGTFSTGAVIKHTFPNYFFGQNYQGPTPEICRVRRVVFADGTVSVSPPLPPEPGIP